MNEDMGWLSAITKLNTIACGGDVFGYQALTHQVYGMQDNVYPPNGKFISGSDILEEEATLTAEAYVYDRAIQRVWIDYYGDFPETERTDDAEEWQYFVNCHEQGTESSKFYRVLRMQRLGDWGT